jgi:hypothetical protein
VTTLSSSSVMVIRARAVLPFIISMSAAVVYRMAVPIHLMVVVVGCK